MPESNHKKFISKGNSPCKQEFPEVKNKRQIGDHYLLVISIITSHYGIFILKFCHHKHNKTPHRIQTEVIELDLSKVFIDCSKTIQHQNSQKANVIFTKGVFSINYSYVSILELSEVFYVSPPQTSRHAKVRHKINLFSQLLDSFCETLTQNEKSQIVKVDLKKILT